MPVANNVKLRPEDLVMLAGKQIGVVIEIDDNCPGVYYKVLIEGKIYSIHRDDMMLINDE
mgnify:CR=1 FL=1|tara:strand:+ start:4563 stop:4742 length:180 start_codon:yes stop_codon:yes gene_type:complete